MLSRILSSSLAGTTRRMLFSTRSQRRAVSSIRVPVLARRCSMNWPLSVAGKKSWPSHGISSPPERHKEIFRHSRQEEHRQKYDTDAESRYQRWNGDLRCAVENCLPDFLALVQ